MEAQSEYVQIARTFFARLAPSLYAQSVTIKQNFCIGAQEEVY